MVLGAETPYADGAGAGANSDTAEAQYITVKLVVNQSDAGPEQLIAAHFTVTSLSSKVCTPLSIHWCILYHLPLNSLKCYYGPR